MPNKNVPVQGSGLGAGFTAPSASSSFGGNISTPQMPNSKTWPVDTGMPSGVSSNSQVSSSGSFLPSLLSFGSPLLGAGLGFLSNMFGFNNQLDEQLRREQFQREWRDNERAYNSPAAQIDRLNAAGLNGKLLLSQQGLSQGQTAPQNGNVSPTFDGTGPAAMLAQGGATAANMLMQQKLMQAQIDNIEAQTNKTHAETMLLPEQLKGLSMSNDTYSATQYDIIKQTRLQTIKQLAENRITDANARIQEIVADVQEKFGHRDAEWNFKILDKQYNQLVENILTLQKNREKIDSDILVNKTIKELNHALSDFYKANAANIRLTTANTPRLSNDQLKTLSTALVDKATSEIRLMDANAEYTGARTVNQNFENRLHPGRYDESDPIQNMGLQLDRTFYRFNRFYNPVGSLFK